MPWFVKIEQGIVDKPTFDLYVPAHLAFVQDLIDRGHQAQTGYWQEKGGGMLLFEASCLAEAEAIVAHDPLVINHCVQYKLHEWHIVMGNPLTTCTSSKVQNHVTELAIRNLESAI